MLRHLSRRRLSGRFRPLSAESLERREVLSAQLLPTAPPLLTGDGAWTPSESANTASILQANNEGEPPAGPPGTYITMIDSGPSANRVDVVFLGDGYRAEEIDTAYIDHINSMIDHVFFENEDPFPRYRNFFNIHRIDVISAESGADKPPEGVFRDTALDAGYYCSGTERLICISTTKANQALSNGLAGAPFAAEMKLVTVNDTKYGGSGGSYAVYAGGNASAPELALHELGHSFSNLADEYEGNTGSYVGSEPPEVNVTKSPSGAKWSHWLGYEQPGIGVIGAYEGGRYYSQDIYRPSLDSKMRSLNRPFDAVAREKIILDIYQYVDPLDDWLANTSTVIGAAPWIDVIDPDVIEVEWLVDGVIVPGASGESLNLPDYGYLPGTYTVTARAYDPTDWVRINRQQLEQSITWTVLVTVQNDPPVAADDSALTNEDQDVLIDVLANDVDPNGPLNPAFITITQPPANGVAAVDLASGAIRYTPAPNYFGADVLRYTVYDEYNEFSNEATVTIDVLSVNDEPTGIVVSPSTVAENAIGAIVGVLSAQDADIADTHVFSTDDERFEIVGDTLRLRDGVSFDHETTPTATVAIAVVDSAVPPASVDFDVTITIDDVNEPPSGILFTPLTVYEHVQRAVIGALSIVDPDEAPIYEYLLSDDRFEVSGGALRVKPGYLLTAAADDGLVIELTARDVTQPSLTATMSIPLEVLANTNPWHNWIRPLDVDGDTLITPTDVLMVINYINTAIPNTILPAPPQLPFAPPPYVDVSNDRIAAPNDVLAIINFLILPNPPAEGEGESIVAGAATHQQLARRSVTVILSAVDDFTGERRSAMDGPLASPSPQPVVALTTAPPARWRHAPPRLHRMDRPVVEPYEANKKTPHWDAALLDLVDRESLLPALD